MNIGALATATGVTPDTLRYYEREGLVDAPRRGDNGYRQYGDADVARVRFVRGAQALGFTLAEIRVAVGRLRKGRFCRADIEAQLHRKVAEIDAHMAQLRALKKELLATFASLTCEDPAAMRPALPARRAEAPPSRAKVKPAAPADAGASAPRVRRARASAR